jgi:ABC-type multidrug transport system fused ATPase/permease subunit
MRDPELYAAWKKHIEHGFANNQIMFQQLLTGFMNPYWTTVWMYRILFGLGVASFLVAAGLSAFANKEGYTLIFGGLSALSLLAYFFNRPLQALEENLQFITWLGLIYNSYWTRLLYLNSQPDVQKGLQESTDDAIVRIKELMAAHAKRSGKRVPFPE